MDSLGVKSFHISFLETFSLPIDRIEQSDRVKEFHKQNNYYESILQDKFHKKRFFVKGVGEFRSVLEPRHLNKKKGYPRSSTIWGSMAIPCQSAVSSIGHLPFLPCIPTVIDFLPSKQRTYTLDLSQLHGSLPKADKEKCKLSISIYYFPVGFAVLRIGLFFQAQDYAFDPDDIKSLKSPVKPIQVSILKFKKGSSSKKPSPLNGLLFDIARVLEKRFIKEFLELESESEPQILDRYSLIDLVDTSRSIDVKTDQQLIFKLIESTNLSDSSVMPPNISYRMLTKSGDYDNTGITICGDKFGFIWTPSSVFEPLRLLHRRDIRNLAMLLMIQKSLDYHIRSLESMSPSDQIKNKLFVKQMKDGIVGPTLKWPLSFMHYLQAQQSFETDTKRKGLYANLRKSVDQENIIEKNESKIKLYFDRLEKEVKQSADSVHEIFSKIINTITSLK